MATPLQSIDHEALDRYLHKIDVARSGELRIELIAGGASNLTFLVSDDVSKWVLRRPPLYGVTPSAHDVAREYRAMAALRGTAVPVAPVVTMCHDESVLGAPFQIVEYVPGRVVRYSDELSQGGGKAAVSLLVDALIRVLANLHAVNPEAVGLADFGKPAGYLQRQVRRWGSQWAHVRRDNDASEADVRRLHNALTAAVPQQGRTAIVHGDYRIDNTILDAEDNTEVVAVLDWEMSTLGDPLGDAALTCVYRHSLFNLIHPDSAWASPLMPKADEIANRYSLATGQPLDNWNFYMALGYFKVAILAAGIAFRARRADSSADGGGQVQEAVAPFIAEGLSALG